MPNIPGSKTMKTLGSSVVSAVVTTQRLFRNVVLAPVSENFMPLVGGRTAKLVEHNDTSLLLAQSPTEQNKKLEAYSLSYDLGKYADYAKEAAEQTKKASSSLLAQHVDKDGNRSVDIMTFGELGKTIEKKPGTVTDDLREESIRRVQLAIGMAIPQNALIADGGPQEKFKALQQAINDPSQKAYQDPAQITHTFNQIRDDAFKKLKEDKDKALKAIDDLFIDSQASAPKLSDFKKQLGNVLGLTDTEINSNNQESLEQTDAKLNKHKKTITDTIEEAYTKAETSLKEVFEDKPATQEKDKEIPGAPGLSKKVMREKERCEADLLRRIKYFENLERRDPNAMDKVVGQKFSGQVGATPLPDHIRRKRCLKDKPLETLEKIEIKGRMWGTGTLNETTTSGTPLKCETENGKMTVTMEIPGEWFIYHLLNKNRMQADFNDMVDTIKAQNKDIPSIHFTHTYETEELRNKAILASYRAAREKGFLPGEITMTVPGATGPDGREIDLTNKSALEVIKALGLGKGQGLIEADAAEIQKEKDSIATGQKSSLKNDLMDLKLSPAIKTDEDEDNKANATPTSKP